MRLFVAAVAEAEALQGVDRRHVRLIGDHHFWKDRPDRQALEEVVFGQVRIVEISAGPTGIDDSIGRAGLPDLSGAEMREVGIGVVHALQHGDAMLIK